MKKLFSILLIAVVLCFSTAVSGDSVVSRVTDSVSDTLTAEQQTNLAQKLDGISERTGYDVLVYLTDSIDGKTEEAFVEEYYDWISLELDIDRGAVILLVALQERIVYIDCADDAKVAVSYYDVEDMLDAVTDDLSNGEYYSACITFAEMCDSRITAYINGTSSDSATNYNPPYDNDYNDDYNYDYGEGNKSDILYLALFAVIAGVIVGFISVSVMKSKLRSVRPQNEATSYVVPGSMQVTVSYDSFLYRNVTRRERPRNNNNGRSGGGGFSSRGGGFGGGGFGGGRHRGSGRRF